MSETATPTNDTLSFEDAVTRLEAIVAEMESGDTNLDEMIKRFEEGQKLVKLCSQKLSAVERKVELITKNADGSFDTVPFAE